MNFRVFLLVMFCIAAGAALRLDFLFATDFVIDSDEAIVGLMAKHALERGTMPVFYYGQHYMGSFEPLVAAAVFKVAGVSEAALKFVPLFFSLLLIALMYQLTREIAGRAAGGIAAVLTAVPPSPLVVWSAMARGGFIELVVIGAYALLITVRWLKDQCEGIARLVLLGVVLGFGWWVNNQILYFAAPVGFALLAKQPAPPRRRIPAILSRIAIVLPAFIAGGLPFWIYNLTRNFPSFGLFRRASIADALEHLEGLLTVSVPMLLGAKRFWNTADILPGLSTAVGAIYVLLLVAFLVLRFRRIAQLAAFRLDRAEPIELALIFLAAAFAIFVISSFGYLVTAPRYLLPSYVGVILLTSYVTAVLWRRSTVAGSAVLTLLLLVNLGSSYFGGRAVPGQPFVFEGERASRNHSELHRWLSEHGVTMVRTNYWIGYRLAFETGERVRFAVFQEPRQVRIAEYEGHLARGERERLPLVLVPAQAVIVRRALEALGVSYSEEMVSGYVVLFNLTPRFPDLEPLRNLTAHASATHKQDAAALAMDGDPETRWGSAAPQMPGMEYTVRFSEPVSVRGVRYQFGAWGHDEPRGLLIEALLPGGGREVLLNPDQYWAVRYLQGARDGFTLSFEQRTIEGIVLRQTGSHELFDWSIAELELLN